MSYTDTAQWFSFNHKSENDADTTTNDNTDLWNIMIPANREIEIQNILTSVRQASGAATDSIEVTLDDNMVKAQVFLGSTGFIAARGAGASIAASSASTFPIRIAPQSTTATTSLKLRSNGAMDATTEFTIALRISGI